MTAGLNGGEERGIEAEAELKTNVHMSDVDLPLGDAAVSRQDAIIATAGRMFDAGAREGTSGKTAFSPTLLGRGVGPR